MLVLSRRVGEEIVIGDNVRIVVVKIERGRVKLGVEAPGSVPVDREEIRQRRREAMLARSKERAA